MADAPKSQTFNTLSVGGDFPAYDRQNFNGDYFPEGQRYRGEVAAVQRVVQESGWEFIELWVKCTKSPDPELVGKKFRQTFTVPDVDELAEAQEAEDENKINSLSWQMRKFSTLVKACGHKELSKGMNLDLNKLVGDEFEFTTQDYQPDRKSKVKGMGGKIVEKKTKGELRSNLRDIYSLAAAESTPSEDDWA